jgi:hypothetical protein
MSETSTNGREAWVAGWCDGVLGLARGKAETEAAKGPSDYVAGLTQGKLAFDARHEPVAFAVRRGGLSTFARGALRATAAAAAFVVVASTWGSLDVARSAVAAENRSDVVDARFHARTPVSDLLEVAFSTAPESDRLAALSVLTPRAARGEVDVARREAFVEMVRRETSPAVALEAAAVARGLS